MEQYQKTFIEFAIKQKVLRFGEFTLKSGRISPYFFDCGLFNDGKSLVELGRFYAAAVDNANIEFDMIYGPAYKGIPLASAITIAFKEDYNNNYPFCFNRKEAKEHGERGITFGADINGRVLIIDDVITAGTSIRDSMAIISNSGGKTAAVVVALDRQERGQGGCSAIQELEQNHELKVINIISLGQIIAYLSENKSLSSHLEAINRYRHEYGIGED